jgi:hypothetical protein
MAVESPFIECKKKARDKFYRGLSSGRGRFLTYSWVNSFG